MGDIGDRMPQLHYEFPEMEKSAKMWLNCLALGKKKKKQIDLF